jgi:hypothetical protein
VGQYFFADYCGGWIRRVDPTNNGTVTGFASGLSFPVDLRTSADGSLYYLTRGTGSNTGGVGRIEYTPDQAPRVTTQPSGETVAVGQSATFSVTASGTAPLSYRWSRNGVKISGATSSSYTLASAAMADNGATFQCVVSNTVGTTTSVPATLTVTNNQSPTAIITTPTVGTRYRGGQTITFAGSAADRQQGTLPANAFTWEVRFHHDDHYHSVLGPIAGTTSGSFTVPTIGETSANVFYRIILTVTDAQGLTDTTVRDVQPRTVTLRLATRYPSLRLSLDGQSRTAPFRVISVVGMRRSIGAPTPQTVEGKTYQFRSWSDGDPATHTISVPAVNTKYRATYAITGYTVTLSRTGAGAGTVTSTPGGVSCGFDCVHTYASGTVVTLTATPSSNSTFTGWGGTCSGTVTCRVTMTGNRWVTARFALRP